MTRLDLDLLFERSPDGYRVRVLRSPAGDGQSAAFAQPFTDLELENFVLKFGKFRSRTRRVEAAPIVAAKQVGGRLHDAVFAGAVGECLHRSIDRARDKGTWLRIRLLLSACPELADLPWELLYDRSDDWFLALSDRTPVVRYVQLPDSPRPLSVTPPLRILVIRSEPEDLPELDVDAEWAEIAAALAELTEGGLIACTELAAPTLSELRRALQSDTFHGLHYMGHGGFDQQHGGVLYFTDRSGRAVPVTGGDLGVMLRDHTSMRLAVLNACEGARIDPADPFAGVADTLVRRGIPAVVAMQFGFSDEAAIEFAPALYGALAAGRPVDAAMAEARKAVYAIGSLEWATPVLYLRADNALLFDIDEQRTPVFAIDRIKQGDSFRQQQRYVDAETVYREAIRVDPGNAEAHNGLGKALNSQERYPEAEAAYREATRLDPANGQYHHDLGDALTDQDKYPEAEAAYREATRLDPANAEYHHDLGVALSGQDKYPQAEAAYREAIRLDPGNPRFHYHLGDALYGQDKHPQTEAALREAARLDPANGQYHEDLGILLAGQERYPEAEAALREAARLDPANRQYHEGLGILLAGQERYPEAEAAYREAIRLDPGNPRLHCRLGDALAGQDKHPEAEAAYREATRLDPGNGQYHDDLGDALYDQEKYRKAEAAYREAVRLDPDNAIYRNDLGFALRNRKRHPEAEAAFREATRLDPGNGQYHDDLGDALYDQEKYPEAAAAYREAIRLDPGNGQYHNDLGVALSYQDKYTEAAAAYREAIRLDPGNTRFRANLRRVRPWG